MGIIESFLIRITEKISRKIRYGLLSVYVIDRVTNGFEKVGIEARIYYIFLENYIEELAVNFQTHSYREKLLVSSDMESLSAIVEYGYSKDELLRRLSLGSQCFCLMDKKNVASFTWFDIDKHQYKLLPFLLKTGEIYIFDAFTPEKYRRKNLAFYLRHRLHKKLNMRGLVTYFSITAFGNRPALKFKRKLRAKPLKLCLYICVFGKYKRIFTIKDYEEH